MTITYIIVAVMAYLLGSIPFGLILVKLFRGTDVRRIGSGNIGATNVMRTGSKGLGIATLMLDAAKGSTAVWLAREVASARFGVENGVHIWMAAGMAAVFAMVGHIFPMWLRFKGGKGVATGVGVFLALVPKAVLIVLGVFALIFAASRYVSLASIIATAAFPGIAYAFLRGADGVVLMPFIVSAAVLIIAKHHQNIRRLMSGTENRLELKSR